MQWIVFGIGVVGMLVVLGFITSRLLKRHSPPPLPPSPQPITATVIRQTALKAAQDRCAAATEEANYQDTMLMLEEDAEFYRKDAKETREARRARRRPPTTGP